MSTRIAEFKIRLGNHVLEARVVVPDAAVALETMVPIFQGFSSHIEDLAKTEAAEAGTPISCAVGCSACCRQLVPVNPPELRFIATVLADLPDEHRERVEARFAVAEATLDQLFGLEQLSRLEGLDRVARGEVAGNYFRAQLDCPFLEDDTCSIWRSRPMACREYAVTSPPEQCADPSLGVSGVHAPASPNRVMRRLRLDGSNEPLPLMPLTLLRYWMAHHADDPQPVLPATDVLSRFLHALCAR